MKMLPNCISSGSRRVTWEIGGIPCRATARDRSHGHRLLYVSPKAKLFGHPLLNTIQWCRHVLDNSQVELNLAKQSLCYKLIQVTLLAKGFPSSNQGQARQNKLVVWAWVGRRGLHSHSENFCTHRQECRSGEYFFLEGCIVLEERRMLIVPRQLVEVSVPVSIHQLAKPLFRPSSFNKTSEGHPEEELFKPH
ncbi:hypothetical protein DNTS_031753 [Danionella cerebrum]|uniref:Uncharacterized protein n=1 Tax=Danionella cerebrum TaxID=2873325 RepID=A0A553QBE8_9TELE|nr:hypothetical protein DNTS_031753 [Danionella translucida]